MSHEHDLTIILNQLAAIANLLQYCVSVNVINI